MRNLFGNRRRSSDERRSGGPVRPQTQTHPIFSDALAELPNARWAAACNAEFRVEGNFGLRGILHHDGALLRFTTWAGTERFVGAPMEFTWVQTSDETIRISSRGQDVWFNRLTPLSSFVANPPSFAAPEDEPLTEAFLAWMLTWAPSESPPLTSPM